MTREQRILDIVDALRVLDITAEKLLAVIDDNLDRNNYHDALNALAFVDKLVNAVDENYNVPILRQNRKGNR